MHKTTSPSKMRTISPPIDQSEPLPDDFLAHDTYDSPFRTPPRTPPMARQRDLRPQASLPFHNGSMRRAVSDVHSTTPKPNNQNSPSSTLPWPDAHPTLPPTVPPQLAVGPVGYYKDLQGTLDAIPAQTLATVPNAGERLVLLKKRLNALQRKRKSYWVRQGTAVGAGAAGAWVSLGGSMLLSSAATLHQRNRLAQIKRAMREVIQQINQIRANFATHPGWIALERQAKIDPGVFSKDIQRCELWGDL